MIVRLRLLGVLERYLGCTRAEVELPSGATLRDLLHAIDARWGQQLPDQFWDGEAKRFQGGVLIMAGNTDIHDDDTPLADQQELLLVPVLAGG